MSKKNQIEEITELLWHFPKAFYSNCYDNCEEIAKLLYEEGYRKQSEGEWELVRPNGSYYCSCCGKGIKIKYGERAAILWDYCPNCGAHMRKEDEVK